MVGADRLFAARECLDDVERGRASRGTAHVADACFHDLDDLGADASFGDEAVTGLRAWGKSGARLGWVDG